MRPYEKEIIILVENVIKAMKYEDHPYDIASDVYNAIQPILLDIYSNGYDDGATEPKEELLWSKVEYCVEDLENAVKDISSSTLKVDLNENDI